MDCLRLSSVYLLVLVFSERTVFDVIFSSLFTYCGHNRQFLGKSHGSVNVPCKYYTFVSRSGFGDKVADREKRYVIDASCFFLVSWHRCLQLKFKTSLKCCRNSSLTREYIIGLAALFASNRIVHML